MADALASGASGSNTVWVQVPSPARKALRNQGFFLCLNIFLYRFFADDLLYFIWWRLFKFFGRQSK